MLLPIGSRYLCRNAPRYLQLASQAARPLRSWRAASVFDHRTIATTTPSKGKPYYITTPIFYVNAAPHLGHLYTLVLTDVYKRWRAVLGETDAEMLTGTDEHGIKIQKAAAQAGVDVKLFCDENCTKFQQLAKAANVDYNYFIRTTDLDHKKAVKHAWEVSKHHGYIYQAKHEGWYSIGDETFYPESQVHLVLDPATGRKHMASMETGREVEWSSEINYHFRLSNFREKLLKFYEDNPDWVTPQSRMTEVIQWVETGLEDLSISRPSERLSWGIPVPGDESQTIYVWVDALMNYATRAGYPFTPGQESAKGWPADVHVIGKDIARFHCVYWPALLMALGLPLPRRILTHAHWTMGSKKMSKSDGNVVNPFLALGRFGVDPLRFYLIYQGGIADDSNYENRYVARDYRKCLQGGLGNLVSRLVRAKRYNIRRTVERASQKSLPPLEEPDETYKDAISKLAAEVTRLMDELNSRGALQAMVDAIYQANAYLELRRPYRLVEDDHAMEQGEADHIIFNLIETVRIVGILLQPIMPEKMKMLFGLLGVDENRRTIEYAQFGADASYGVPTIPLGKGSEGTLFPPRPTDEY